MDINKILDIIQNGKIKVETSIENGTILKFFLGLSGALCLALLVGYLLKRSN